MSLWHALRSLPTARAARRAGRRLELETLEVRQVPAILGTPNQDFVDQVYKDLLKREVDATGLAVWPALLDQGFSRFQVVSSIQQSLENRTDQVQRLYHLLLDRSADPTGLNADVAFLQAGGRIEAVAANILGSDEFFQHFGGTNDRFLDELYEHVLGRPVDASGRAGWSAVLAGGVDRTLVATLIEQGPENLKRQVKLLYTALLRRDGDDAGISFWVGVGREAGIDAVIAGLLSSNEYFALAQQLSPTVPGINQTTTTVTASSSTSGLNQPITFTATLHPSVNGPLIASGTVEFREGSTLLSTATLTNGTASFMTSALPAGSHTITAVYLGDSNFATSQGSAGVTVNQASTTTTLISLNPGVNVNQTVTFQATISTPATGPITPGGTVQFIEDVNGTQTVLDTQNVTSATVRSAALSLSGGTHTILAIYSGDSNFTGSTSRSITQVVNLSNASVSVTVVSSSPTSNLADPVTFTATVADTTGSGFTPTGNVTFMDELGNTYGTVALDANGQATSTAITTLSGGSHTITAVYDPNGDPNFGGGNGSTSQTVNPAATAISLVANNPTTILTQQASFTATVTPTSVGSFSLSGRVTFIIDGAAQTPVVVVNGSATFATSNLGVGVHTISAVYNANGADVNFAQSTSNSVQQTVNKADTTTSHSFSNAGQLRVTFSTTVTANVNGAPTPTGTVDFIEGGNVLDTRTLVNGSATSRVITLTAASHTITIRYNGDSNFNGSSAQQSLTFSDQDDSDLSDENGEGTDLFI